MPSKIRPVREEEDKMPGIFKDGGYEAMGLSSLQLQMLGEQPDRTAALQRTTVDERDVELLHQIWLGQNGSDEDLVRKAAEARKGGFRMEVQKDVEDYELMRLKTHDLVVGAGRDVSLTKKGDKVLKDKILATRNNFFLNRTKERADAAEPMDKAASSQRKLHRVAEKRATNGRCSCGHCRFNKELWMWDVGDEHYYEYGECPKCHDKFGKHPEVTKDVDAVFD